MLTVNFVLMTICVTMTGTPRQSVTIFQVLLSQINTKPPLSSQLPDPSQGREEDNVEVVTTLQELRNDHVPISPAGSRRRRRRGWRRGRRRRRRSRDIN